ncbi:MAG: thioredoxin family protein [Pseudomonadota bacterium]|nr:thioredoxin family protein [Pseudomonadota bacterium]
MIALLAPIFVASALAETPVTAAAVGTPAPDFALRDLSGKEVKLSAYKGTTVVVEWFNPGCPFVVYAHGEGPLKDMAKKTVDTGVVWLTVNSSAPGKQGHGLETNQQAVATWGITNPVLLDESGAVGKSYGATTTPNMFVVDPKGTLVYAGALDNAPLGKAEGAPVNYVKAAIDDVAAGRPVATPTTKPYGCGVKYGS